MLRWGAALAILGGIAMIMINVLLLNGTADVPISEGLQADFAVAEMVRIVAAIAVFVKLPAAFLRSQPFGGSH